MGLLVSISLVLVRGHLPLRTLDLLATPIGKNPLLMNQETGHLAGDTLLEWVDRDTHHWHCETDSARNLPICGIFFDLGRREVGEGMNLSRFREVILGVRYRGTAEHLRVVLAQYDRIYSEQDDHHTRRPYAGYFSTNASGLVTVPLAGMVLPEWWLTSPQGSRQPVDGLDLSNCVTLTVDVPYIYGKAWHDIEVTHLELRGEWVTKAELYSVLLWGWLALMTVVVILRLRAAHEFNIDQERMINALAEREKLLRAEQAKLQHTATVDALTGLLNRHGMAKALAELPDSIGPMCMLLVDVDHFKDVNDRFGHAEGDSVLRRIAALLTQNLRAQDIVCRWGGEEFVVCAACGLEDAERIAEKMRQLAADKPLTPKVRIVVTISIGITPMTGPSEFESALERADAAMYRAKAQGRNQVVVEPPPAATTSDH